jgi:hypothetical protein
MTTWGDKLLKISASKLNQLAAAEFSKERIYAACAERAGLGFTWAEIRPSRPVDVKECEAVQALLVELAKEKVRIEWSPVQEGPDHKFLALRISWEKRR